MFMRKIFIGMIFVFLDFTININATKIGLIPDFIGYIFMTQGLSELTAQSPRFERMQPYATGMAIYTAILYALDLFGVSMLDGIVNWLLGLASTIISLYISYNIVMGVRDIEIAGRELNGSNLLTTWKVYAVISLAIYILYLIPVINILLIIAGLVMGIVFLVAFNRTKNLYDMV